MVRAEVGDSVVDLSARVAALEAEREKLRAVVLAVAEACEKVGAGASGFPDMARAFRVAAGRIDVALDIHPARWADTADALRALAGGAS